jgi:hypothetical protein
MSFMKGTKPKRSAQWFFTVADAILEDLVKKEGWQSYSRDKGCCCRVVVDAEHHIDVPLYAIRDEAYQALVKAASAWLRQLCRGVRPRRYSQRRLDHSRT